jgi:hypothetical protein
MKQGRLLSGLSFHVLRKQPDSLTTSGSLRFGTAMDYDASAMKDLEPATARASSILSYGRERKGKGRSPAVHLVPLARSVS